MNKLCYLLALVLPLLLMSCDNSVNPILNSGSGKLKISLDKENAPSDVVSVTATLTKSDENPVSASMNLKQDSSADITLNDLNAGDWKLNVEAFNADNKVIYSGETNVTIVENTVVSVNLVLNPVANGTGSIQIFVTWGTNAGNQTYPWIDNYGIILGGGTNDFAHPNVIKENGIFKMWFSDVRANCIKYAHSTNGINWTIEPVPALSPKDSIFTNVASVSQPKVIKFNNEYYMYFSGRNSYGTTSIGYVAVSLDGITWHPNNNPYLTCSSSNGFFDLSLADVLLVNGKIYMFYSARSYVMENYLATSTDGINFTKVEQTDATGFPWQSGVYNPSVIFENGKFKMFYMNYPAANQIGYAESSDLITWTKDPAPAFKIDGLKNCWGTEINNLCYRNFDGQYRLYIGGYKNSYHSIGLLEARDILTKKP